MDVGGPSSDSWEPVSRVGIWATERMKLPVIERHEAGWFVLTERI